MSSNQLLQSSIVIDHSRQVVLDTETTGLDYNHGHRILEIGCTEIKNRRLTGRTFHCYLNPDREIEAAALNVHGITSEFLQDKPRFDAVVDELLSFINGAELLAHNAPFDVGFLNNELHLARGKRKAKGEIGKIEDCCQVVDTLTIARKKHPGQRNSLDALVKRYQVTGFKRDLHGALLDAEILARVYLAMTCGQMKLACLSNEVAFATSDAVTMDDRFSNKPLVVISADENELQAHQQFLQLLQQESDREIVW